MGGFSKAEVLLGPLAPFSIICFVLPTLFYMVRLNVMNYREKTVSSQTEALQSFHRSSYQGAIPQSDSDFMTELILLIVNICMSMSTHLIVLVPGCFVGIRYCAVLW